jgi:hypothetical protein
MTDENDERAEELYDLVCAMLEYDYQARISSYAVVNHSYILRSI